MEEEESLYYTYLSTKTLLLRFPKNCIEYIGQIQDGGKNRYKYSGLNLSKTETLNTQYIEEIKYVQELSLKAKATLSPRLDVSGTYAKYLGATNLYDCKGTPSRLALVSIKVLLVLIPLIASIPYLLL
jgi:hypothetical protein